jgi:hypothetical protein
MRKGSISLLAVLLAGACRLTASTAFPGQENAPADFAPRHAAWTADGKVLLLSATHATLEDVRAGKRLGA